MCSDPSERPVVGPEGISNMPSGTSLLYNPPEGILLIPPMVWSDGGHMHTSSGGQWWSLNPES